MSRKDSKIAGGGLQLHVPDHTAGWAGLDASKHLNMGRVPVPGESQPYGVPPGYSTGAGYEQGSGEGELS